LTSRRGGRDSRGGAIAFAPMLDVLFRPLRAALGTAEHEVAHSPLQRTEEDILDTVNALRRATDSIEHHVEVIESLATSVTPLTESVNTLTATMTQLVAVLAPLAAAERGVAAAERGIHEAEHEVKGIERLFGRHRHGQ